MEKRDAISIEITSRYSGRGYFLLMEPPEYYDKYLRPCRVILSLTEQIDEIVALAIVPHKKEFVDFFIEKEIDCCTWESIIIHDFHLTGLVFSSGCAFVEIYDENAVAAAHIECATVKDLYDQEHEFSLKYTPGEVCCSRNLQNIAKYIQRTAESLGVDSFKPVPLKPVMKGKKLQQIMKENEQRAEVDRIRKEKLLLKGILEKYNRSTMGDREHMFRTVYKSDFIQSRMLLLKIEFLVDKWNFVRRREVVDFACLVELWDTCIQVLGLGIGESEREFVISTLRSVNFVETAKELNGESFVVAENELGLQMLYAGDRLPRSLNSRIDSRVPFKPDGWQVSLLDAVDAGQSCVVVAPTSSGKTFIAYYAISILKEEDTLLFVLPTKALVNQVLSDIHARFSYRTFKTNRVLSGVFSPKYSTDNERPQILIALPEYAKDIFTQPKFEKIRKSLRYVIIDEVHVIDDSIIGTSIEECIISARCPSILLSATIGNVEQFNNFIRMIEERKNIMYKFVYHNERYSELKYYLWQRSLNLINSLCVENADMRPEEIHQMLTEMYAAAGKAEKKVIRSLMPGTFFKSNLISKRDVNRYQQYLINEIKHMKCFIDYKSSLYPRCKNECVGSLNECILTLKEHDMVPCLAFHHDRMKCNELAECLFEEISNIEAVIPKNKTAAEKRMRDKKPAKNDWIEESQNLYENAKVDRVPRLVNPLYRKTPTEIHQLIRDINCRNIDKRYIEMLIEGIGVHHGGMNRKYRLIVEYLFRQKHLSVVFCTETLSLGINMPCKTVVICDMNNLSATQFKQMSGRAGRRGYDLTGNVIFIDGTRDRILGYIGSNSNDILGRTSPDALSIAKNQLASFMGCPFLENISNWDRLFLKTFGFLNNHDCYTCLCELRLAVGDIPGTYSLCAILMNLERNEKTLNFMVLVIGHVLEVRFAQVHTLDEVVQCKAVQALLSYSQTCKDSLKCESNRILAIPTFINRAKSAYIEMFYRGMTISELYEKTGIESAALYASLSRVERVIIAIRQIWTKHKLCDITEKIFKDVSNLFSSRILAANA